MTSKPYRVSVEGYDVNGNSWSTVTDVRCQFHQAFQLGLADSFEQLTNGKATYGNPGMGCTGPYDIRKVVIEQVIQ